jgi:hypothetical protein
LEAVGHWGGLASKVVADGDRVYLAQWNDFTVLDVSNPTHIRKVGYQLLPGYIVDFIILDGYIYVAWEQQEWLPYAGGIKVFSLEGEGIEPVGSYELTGPAISLTAVGEKYLYVSYLSGETIDYFGRLDILDRTKPANLQKVNGLGPMNATLDMAVSTSYGYVLDGSYLDTYDLSDPIHPFTVSSIIAGGNNIVISGTYAYMGGAFLIASLADPIHPTVPGLLSVDGDVNAIAVHGHHAYVSVKGHYQNDGQLFYGGLKVIDVISPTAPVEVAYLPMAPYGSRGLDIQGKVAYVSMIYNGLSAVDISDPLNPRVIGSYQSPGEVDDVAISNGRMYNMADYPYPGASGLWISSLSDLAQPDWMGYYQIFQSQRLAFEGNYAYPLARPYYNYNFHNYLQVVDVSDPANPLPRGRYNFTSDIGALRIAAHDGYVYMTQTPTLTIVDARNPDALTLASQITATQGILEVAVRGDYAYLSDGGLRIFDVRDPAHPLEVGTLPFADGSGRLAVWDRYAYVVGGKGLHVVDISDLQRPEEVGLMTFPWDINDLAAEGGYVFMADFYEGLKVVNAQDPRHPVEAARYLTPCCGEAVTLHKGLVYLANSRAGLYILRFNPLVHLFFLPMVGL